jgi:hypothetical protein
MDRKRDNSSGAMGSGYYDMSEPTPRFMQIFSEIFETPPRQGTGNCACAAKALALCTVAIYRGRLR